MNFDIMNFLMDFKESNFETEIKITIQEENSSKGKSPKRILTERKNIIILSDMELNNALNLSNEEGITKKIIQPNFEDIDFNDIESYDKITISFPIFYKNNIKNELGTVKITLRESKYDFIIDCEFNFAIIDFIIEEDEETIEQGVLIEEYFFNNELLDIIKIFSNNGMKKEALIFFNKKIRTDYYSDFFIDFCLFDEYNKKEKLNLIDCYIVSLMSKANDTKKIKTLLKELESDEHRELFDNSKEFIKEVISVTNPSNIKELVENLELRFGR